MPISRGRLQMFVESRRMGAPPFGVGFSHDENLRSPRYCCCRVLWIRELGVLAGEIPLYHPRGGRTTLSDENLNLMLDNSCESFNGGQGGLSTSSIGSNTTCVVPSDSGACGGSRPAGQPRQTFHRLRSADADRTGACISNPDRPGGMRLHIGRKYSQAPGPHYARPSK
jgi:hypothetical protein